VPASVNLAADNTVPSVVAVVFVALTSGTPVVGSGGEEVGTAKVVLDFEYDVFYAVGDSEASATTSLEHEEAKIVLTLLEVDLAFTPSHAVKTVVVDHIDAVLLHHRTVVGLSLELVSACSGDEDLGSDFAKEVITTDVAFVDSINDGTVGRVAASSTPSLCDITGRVDVPLCHGHWCNRGNAAAVPESTEALVCKDDVVSTVANSETSTAAVFEHEEAKSVRAGIQLHITTSSLHTMKAVVVNNNLAVDVHSRAVVGLGGEGEPAGFSDSGLGGGFNHEAISTDITHVD